MIYEGFLVLAKEYVSECFDYDLLVSYGYSPSDVIQYSQDFPFEFNLHVSVVN